MRFRRSNAKNLKPLPPAHPLAGKRLWFGIMSEGSSSTLAASFRSCGIDAQVTPPSDARTRELGSRHSAGDECYPFQITLGDYLKVLEQPGVDPAKTAFFLPEGCGPCRFGQYAPCFRHIFDSAGYTGVTLFSTSDATAYAELNAVGGSLLRTAFRGIVVSDILLKLLLKTRPFELTPGGADEIFRESLDDLCRTLEVPYSSSRRQMDALKTCLLRARDRFRALPARFDPERPLIGIVGEIFCRLNAFSNDDLVRRLEEHGAVVWMSDVAEWVGYATGERFRRLRLLGRTVSLDMLAAQLRSRVQRKDEHELTSLVGDDFRGFEEPEDVGVVYRNAAPYLPPEGAMGEMVLNVGRAVYLARKGVDGIIDISPFTCMNGIVGEAIYPRVSADLGGIPIQTFYFDGTQSDRDRDVGIYLELARSYRSKKPFPRTVLASSTPLARAAPA
jgi:predicted nucleotide-binding protein (sugar kinase/HSP70/actin superfamily)